MPSVGLSRGGARFFCNRNHVFSLGGHYRVTTWITPLVDESKRIVCELMGGDEEVMLPESFQMLCLMASQRAYRIGREIRRSRHISDWQAAARDESEDY